MIAEEPEKDWDAAFARFAQQIDLRHLLPADWRDAFRGAERPLAQQYLLEMARKPRNAAHSERLLLYKAAYSILPLHETDLTEFAELLTQDPAFGEWIDALVEALAAQPPTGTLLSAAILRNLQAFCLQDDAGDPAHAAQVACIIHYVALSGHRPSWIRERFLQPEPESVELTFLPIEEVTIPSPEAQSPKPVFRRPRRLLPSSDND